MQRFKPAAAAILRNSKPKPRKLSTTRPTNKNMDTSVQENQAPADQHGETKTVNVRIKGTVQGVYYRKWTVDNALKLGLNGWVRNRRDGSVEAIFSGKPEIVDTMIENCKTGPPAAVVTAVNVEPVDVNVCQGFERRPTE